MLEIIKLSGSFKETNPKAVKNFLDKLMSRMLATSAVLAIGGRVKKNDLVSVILPVHGLSPWLEEALESTLSQTYENLEFVIVFDRPDSSALARASEFARRDSRAVLAHSPGIGLAAALNYGISIAKGTFVARMDSDDVMAASRIEEQVQYLQRFPFLDVLGCQAEYVDEVGSVLGHSVLPTRHKDIAFNLLWANPMIHPSLLMRKTLFEGRFLYDEGLPTGEDYKLLLQMLEGGVKFGNTREFLLKYRRSSSQMTSNEAAQLKFETEIAEHISISFSTRWSIDFVKARRYLHWYLKSRNPAHFLKFWIYSPFPATKLALLKLILLLDSRFSRGAFGSNRPEN